MNNIILPNNHDFLKPSSDIKSLCAPLFQQHNMNMFVYGRYYQDGSFMLLADNEDWLQYHLSQGYMAPAPIPSTILKKKECFHIIPSDGVYSLAKQDCIDRYQTDEAVDYVVRGINYFEVFCFSFCAHEQNAINIIINNLTQFKQFADIFKEKMAAPIRQASKHKMILPEKMSGIDRSQLDACLIRPRKKNDPERSLTQRELEVVKWIVKGKSARETAERLYISRRTVEHHLENVKHKTGTKSKSQLIERCLVMLDESVFSHQAE